MKITAGKREDILRQRDEWDAENQRRESRRQEQSKQFRQAMWEVMEPVKQEVETYLKEYPALTFEVTAESDYRSDKIRVRIRCNDPNHFDDNVALSWNFDVGLDTEGNVLKESGSWSGLKACTETQLESLKQSVDALVMLNQLDWKMLLDKVMPEHKDYFKTPEGEQPLGQRPNFKEQLIEAAVEECVGQDILVLGSAGENSGYRTGADIYYLITSQSPKQYQVKEQLASWVDDWIQSGKKTFEQVIEEMKGYYGYRVTKAKFLQLVESDKDGNITTLSQ